MACTTTLNLLQGGDFPMDGAIYHPTRNSFFTVRGPYVFEYTLALQQLQSSRFTASAYGRSCITYDPVADRIWIGTNGDRAAGYLGDTGGFPGKPAKSTSGLYRIVPSTLVLEQYLNPSVSGLWGGALNDFGQNCGVFDVLVGVGKLFFLYIGSNIGQQSQLFCLNLPALTAFNFPNPSNWSGPSGQLALDNLATPNIWAAQNDDNFNADVMPVWPTNGSGFGNALNSQPTNGAHEAVCFATVNGFIYQIEMPNLRMVKINPTTRNIDSYHNLTGATLGGMTSRLRYNPNDNHIYVPCPSANQMIAYDPMTDTVSKIYTTGMDSPQDAVFAPGGINVAIQSGSSGLKLLTT